LGSPLPGIRIATRRHTINLEGFSLQIWSGFPDLQGKREAPRPTQSNGSQPKPHFILAY